MEELCGMILLDHSSLFQQFTLFSLCLLPVQDNMMYKFPRILERATNLLIYSRISGNYC